MAWEKTVAILCVEIEFESKCAICLAFEHDSKGNPIFFIYISNTSDSLNYKREEGVSHTYSINVPWRFELEIISLHVKTNFQWARPRWPYGRRILG